MAAGFRGGAVPPEPVVRVSPKTLAQLEARAIVRHGIERRFPDLKMPPCDWGGLVRNPARHDCASFTNPYTNRCRDGRRTW